MSEKMNVNPDLYSSLPPKWSNLVKIDSTENKSDPKHQEMVYKDKSTGELYFKLSSSPATQIFVAEMLKGIVSVADVVSIEDNSGNTIFFSKQLDLEEYPEAASANDMTAERILLEVLFADADHDDSHKPSTNIQKNSKNFYFYDFEDAFNDFGDMEDFSYRLTLLDGIHGSVLAVMYDKVNLLRERIEGQGGADFVRSVFMQAKKYNGVLSSDNILFANIPADTEECLNILVVLRESTHLLLKRINQLLARET